MTREEALRYLQAVSLMLLGADNKPIADFYEALNIAIEVLEQEPKTGHWTHDGSHWKNRFICSECGYKLFEEQTNYCPNCGCCMVEPQEGSDKE